MRIVSSFFMGVISFVMLSSTAMADSLYRQWAFPVEVGLVSFAIPSGNNNTVDLLGASYRGRLFVTENIAVSGGGFSVVGTANAGGQTVLVDTTPLLMQAEWHGRLVGDWGYYGGVGYSWTASTFKWPLTNTTTTGNVSGMSYEAGIETVVANLITMKIAYQNIGLKGANMDGYHVDFGIVF